MREREIIERLAALTTKPMPDLLRGIGDDCAVIKKDGSRVWLVTTDTLVESVHFDLGLHPPRLLGRKCVAVNISDIAAMGGEPSVVFFSLALPAGHDDQWLADFLLGVTGACSEYGCVLAGGDTVRSHSGLVVTITIMGQAENDRVLYRDGAKPGDQVWVSGTLGGGAAGLALCRGGYAKDNRFSELVNAHLDPAPRVQLGRALARSGLVHAMLDSSDGLATDLAHICRASGTGALVESDLLPALPVLGEAAELMGHDPLDWLVTGGEDYELIFTASATAADEIMAIAATTGVPLTPVGKVEVKPGLRLLTFNAEGRENIRDIGFKGFEHFA